MKPEIALFMIVFGAVMAGFAANDVLNFVVQRLHERKRRPTDMNMTDDEKLILNILTDHGGNMSHDDLRAEFNRRKMESENKFSEKPSYSTHHYVCMHCGGNNGYPEDRTK